MLGFIPWGVTMLSTTAVVCILEALVPFHRVVKPMLHYQIIVLWFYHFYSFTNSVQRYALYCMLLSSDCIRFFFSIVICALICLASRTIDRSRNHIFLGYNVLIYWLTLHCVLTSTGSLIFSLRNDPNRKIRDTTGLTLLPQSRSIY